MPTEMPVNWRNRIVGHGEESPDQLLANPANWRIHPELQQATLGEVLTRVGWVREVLVNRRTQHVIDGHLRVVMASRRLEPSVPVTYVDLSLDEERLVLATLDPIADMAVPDASQLVGLLKDIPVEDGSALEALFVSLSEEAGSTRERVARRHDPDAVPEMRATDITVGDLFRLGDHRLLCGDCTDPEDVRALMGDDLAALAITSPPYAQQRREQYGGIPEDEYWPWFQKVQAQVVRALKDTGTFVLNIKPHAREQQRSLYVFDLVMRMVRDEQWLLVDEFCWLRNGIPQQVRYRFKNCFEPCYWFARRPTFVWYPEAVMHDSEAVPLALGAGAGDTNAARRQGRGGGAIQGNRIVAGKAYPGNVLDFKQNAEAIGHPAAFPVVLPAFFIQCMSQGAEVVFEPFCGSGTTLIAAEMHGRQCRAIEVLPGYCQMTIDRWETFTGQKAEKISQASESTAG